MTTGGAATSNGGDWTGLSPANTITLNPAFDLFISLQATSNNHTFTITPRGGTGTYSRRVLAGGTCVISGDSNDRVVIDSPDANARWETDVSGTFGPAIIAAGSVTIASSATLNVNTTAVLVAVDGQVFPPTSVPNATAESVVQAGSNAVPIGAIVYYRLEVIGTLTTAADQLTYIALKGESSTAYLAFCGPSAVATGSFRMTSSEKVDIVRANADTTAKVMIAAWDAWTGV